MGESEQGDLDRLLRKIGCEMVLYPTGMSIFWNSRYWLVWFENSESVMISIGKFTGYNDIVKIEILRDYYYFLYCYI